MVVVVVAVEEAEAAAVAAEVGGPCVLSPSLFPSPVQMAPFPFLDCRRSRHGTWTWPASQNQESCVGSCGCENPAGLNSKIKKNK